MLNLAIVDAKIWSPDLLIQYLYQQMCSQEKSIIDFTPEGVCLRSAGVYTILDKFCELTGYNKSNITIRTANLLEAHNHYNIKKDINGWYEIPLIQKWARENTPIDTQNPKYHFANFVSRNHWTRLWLATILNKYHGDKTLQTYNYFNSAENYNPDRYVGLDDLAQRECDVISHAVEFLKTCPRSLDVLEYPIQHPFNMNLTKYYTDIFVDLVVETNVSGNSFLVTEKLWRAIVARRPFIVMSNRNYLSNLKRLGFKTFSDFWSEEYDQFETADRIKMISAILESISQQKDLKSSLSNMNSLLEHNYMTFMNLRPQQIARIFNA